MRDNDRLKFIQIFSMKYPVTYPIY